MLIVEFYKKETSRGDTIAAVTSNIRSYRRLKAFADANSFSIELGKIYHIRYGERSCICTICKLSMKRFKVIIEIDILAILSTLDDVSSTPWPLGTSANISVGPRNWLRYRTSELYCRGRCRPVTIILESLVYTDFKITYSIKLASQSNVLTISENSEPVACLIPASAARPSFTVTIINSAEPEDRSGLRNTGISNFYELTQNPPLPVATVRPESLGCFEWDTVNEINLACLFELHEKYVQIENKTLNHIQQEEYMNNLKTSLVDYIRRLQNVDGGNNQGEGMPQIQPESEIDQTNSQSEEKTTEQSPEVDYNYVGFKCRKGDTLHEVIKSITDEPPRLRNDDNDDATCDDSNMHAGETASSQQIDVKKSIDSNKEKDGNNLTKQHESVSAEIGKKGKNSGVKKQQFKNANTDKQNARKSTRRQFNSKKNKQNIPDVSKKPVRSARRSQRNRRRKRQSGSKDVVQKSSKEPVRSNKWNKENNSSGRKENKIESTTEFARQLQSAVNAANIQLERGRSTMNTGSAYVPENQFEHNTRAGIITQPHGPIEEQADSGRKTQVKGSVTKTGPSCVPREPKIQPAKSKNNAVQKKVGPVEQKAAESRGKKDKSLPADRKNVHKKKEEPGSTNKTQGKKCIATKQEAAISSQSAGTREDVVVKNKSKRKRVNRRKPKSKKGKDMGESKQKTTDSKLNESNENDKSCSVRQPPTKERQSRESAGSSKAREVSKEQQGGSAAGIEGISSSSKTNQEVTCSVSAEREPIIATANYSGEFAQQEPSVSGNVNYFQGNISYEPDFHHLINQIFSVNQNEGSSLSTLENINQAILFCDELGQLTEPFTTDYHYYDYQTMPQDAPSTSQGYYYEQPQLDENIPSTSSGHTGFYFDQRDLGTNTGMLNRDEPSLLLEVNIQRGTTHFTRYDYNLGLYGDPLQEHEPTMPPNYRSIPFRRVGSFSPSQEGEFFDPANSDTMLPIFFVMQPGNYGPFMPIFFVRRTVGPVYTGPFQPMFLFPNRERAVYNGPCLPMYLSPYHLTEEDNGPFVTMCLAVRSSDLFSVSPQVRSWENPPPRRNRHRRRRRRNGRD